MVKRPFGSTGDMLSVLGFGSIILVLHEQNTANRLVSEAAASGINYFDVAPSYGDVFGVRGDAEVKLGPALRPYRKDCFLACKTGMRSRKEAEFEFNLSLERLETDYFDLYQLHGLTNLQTDVDQVFMKGGVMDMLIEKKREGKIRNLGFSAHSTEAALSAMERYDFDSVLFPVNYACWYKGGFGPEIMQKAIETNTARLALKALAKQRRSPAYPETSFPKCWYEPITERDLAARVLRWTLSQPVTAAVSPGEEKLYKLALSIIQEGIHIQDDDLERVKKDALLSNPIFPDL
ncbi:MAG: aldo/keto reductase [Spirochaetes bacterium]|nr:aldo/keto reductase [Spirochaetota bacterium]